MEKARLPSPAEHPSYQLHRRQLWTQILVPILVAVLLLVAIIILISIATFRDGGEVERWAAISTIWIVIPILVAGLVVLLLFVGIVYGMAKLLALIPPYSGYAQKVVWRIEGYVRRGADASIKPVLTVESIVATVKRVFGFRK
jgi:heme/copper-type cytochrome/quinol oxidase subunit 2